MNKLNALLFLTVISISPLPSLAQHGFTAVSDLAEFKKKFADEGKKVHFIQSSFKQEKNLSALQEKIVSNGKFWFAREKKVRIEYLKPFHYLLIINGEQMVIRDDQKENRVSTHSNKLFQQINRILVDCVNGAILENKDFSPRVFQNEKMYLLEMSPTSKTLKDFFETISVELDKKDWSVTSITLREPGGDNTVIHFFDKVINEELNDALFVR